ncbi:aa3-type cytochrome c oxidase subunit IV [Sphingomonas sp. CLY1604]
MPDASRGWMMAGNGDMKAHVATYSSVTAMMKWGTVACAIIALFVIWLIA